MGFNSLSGNEVAAAIDARIKRIAQEVYTYSPSNRTVFGRVVSSSGGVFTVKINSHIYKDVVAFRNVGPIKNNETVVCLIPNNEYSNILILGVADGSLVNGNGENIIITTTTGNESISDGTKTLNVVTRDTAQNIIAKKTFVGQQLIDLKQTQASDQLGFNCLDSNGKQFGSLQVKSRSMRPIGSNSSITYDLVALANWTDDATSHSSTQLGFRSVSDDISGSKAFNFLAPKDTKTNMNALYGSTYDTIYFATALTDGSGNAFADKRGAINLKTINNLSILGNGNISIPTINAISASAIRISDYTSGLYELTYDGEKTIYYSADSTDTTKAFTTSAARFLSITKITTTPPLGGTQTEWDWFATGGTYVFQGYTQTATSAFGVVTYTQNYYETPASITTTTNKRYLLGSQYSANANRANALNTNTSCYMQSGNLYSGGSKVITEATKYSRTELLYSDVSAGNSYALNDDISNYTYLYVRFKCHSTNNQFVWTSVPVDAIIEQGLNYQTNVSTNSQYFTFYFDDNTHLHMNSQSMNTNIWVLGIK